MLRNENSAPRPQPREDSNSQNQGTIGLTLQEYLDRAPPGSEIKHYVGKEGFGNYGYLLINNTWVDPDGQGECLDALRSESTELWPHAVPIIPDGPKIMTRDEEDKFYATYTKEVSCGGDNEGDPRYLRISPATFARWAEGATTGDSYISTEFPAPVSLIYF